MVTSAVEQRVMAEIEQRADELVTLTAELIGFDTTTREGLGAAPRQEVALQQYLAVRLRKAGATVEVWEPRLEDFRGDRQIPPGLSFEGYPQLLARWRGAGDGRSLLLNGHIDVVTAEPREAWTTDPFQAQVRDGRVVGRGACDMKGGVAAMVFAAEVLAAVGVELAGDLLLNTVTDEESTSAGGVASVWHGVRADAGIVPEPTGLRIGVANRGSLMPTIRVPGRSGHAGYTQPHWLEGGAVSATEKAAVLLAAVPALRQEWREHPAHRHPYLNAGDVVATTIVGGEWDVTYPAECRITCHLTYLPQHADEAGYGGRVKSDFESWVDRVAQADPWLASHPPVVEWAPCDVPPSGVATDAPVVTALADASRDCGYEPQLFGTDFWYDGATFTNLGSTPTVAYGPGSGEIAHTVDEFVPVAELVTCAQTLAVTAMRFCGLSPSTD